MLRQFRARQPFAGRSRPVVACGACAPCGSPLHLKPALQVRNDEFVHSIASNVERGDAATAGWQASQGITKATAPKSTWCPILCGRLDYIAGLVMVTRSRVQGVSIRWRHQCVLMRCLPRSFWSTFSASVIATYCTTCVESATLVHMLLYKIVCRLVPIAHVYRVSQYTAILYTAIQCVEARAHCPSVPAVKHEAATSVVALPAARAVHPRIAPIIQHLHYSWHAHACALPTTASPIRRVHVSCDAPRLDCLPQAPHRTDQTHAVPAPQYAWCVAVHTAVYSKALPVPQNRPTPAEWLESRNK